MPATIRETLFYCDPPYLISTRSSLAKVKGGIQYRWELTEKDHIELAEMLHEIKGMAIVSGYPSKLYDRLYADWGTAVTRAWSVSGNHGCSARTECLWISPNARSPHGIELF